MKPYKPDARLFFGLIVAVTIAEIAIADSVFGMASNAMLYKSGAIAAINGLLWVVFDRFAWKWPLARLTGLSHVPDLNGVWKGELKRSGESENHGFTLKINQTFSTLILSTQSNNSSSHSISAAIVTDELKRNFKIVNHWRSRTLAKGKGYMDDFVGLSTIAIEEENGEIILTDYYFTNRKPRSTEGVIRLKRGKPK